VGSSGRAAECCACGMSCNRVIVQGSHCVFFDTMSCVWCRCAAQRPRALDHSSEGPASLTGAASGSYFCERNTRYYLFHPLPLSNVQQLWNVCARSNACWLGGVHPVPVPLEPMHALQSDSLHAHHFVVGSTAGAGGIPDMVPGGARMGQCTTVVT
jgi:hypothetical protein